MCGIAGELRRRASPDRDVLDRMSAALAPRGPDGDGMWFHDGTALAHDRLGIKPLYLHELPDGGLRIASSLPAIVAGGGVDTRVDPVALHHYLSFHSVVPAPRTILRGVRKLPPATLLVLEPDGRRRERR